MAQQSLYRRYRPRRFGELKGQEHVVRALRNAVAQDSEGHAYLFSGPRGTGKTSTARILAKALNCTDLRDGEPCCECDSCLSIEAGRSFDLFELDAASNNGVDAVRDLVERSAVSSPGRTKVYILDEVHMLTAAASNALLKTLEEPPDHVRFVLATTDPQKVLPTIRSRTQHFEFQLLSASELEEHVRWVATDAGLDVDDEAVAHVVRQGRGSVRDTLSALDQVVAAGGVLVRSEPVEQLFEAVAGSDTGAAIVAVADALAQGHDPRVLGEAFLSAVRDAFLLSLGVDTPHIVDTDRERLSHWAEEIGTAGLTRAMERVGQALIDMRNAADPRVPLEVALVQITVADTGAVASGSSGEPASAPAPAPAGSAAGNDATTADLDLIVSRLDRLEAAVRRTKAPESGSAPQPSGERRTEAARPAPTSESSAAEPPGDEPPTRQQLAEPRPETRSADSPDEGAASDSAPAEGQHRRNEARKSAAQRPGPQASGGQARTKRSAPPPPPPRRRGGGAPQTADKAADKATAQPADKATAGADPVGETADVAPGVDAGGDLGAGPDRDALVMAFGDVVVPQLKGVAKALFTAGRFVTVADGAAVFSVENAPTRDRAEKYRGKVEDLLAAHFGTKVPIRLVTESEADSYPTQADESRPAPSPADSPSGAAPSKPPARDRADSASPAPAEQAPRGRSDAEPGQGPSSATAEPEEEVDLMTQVDQLEDADVATNSVDKLTAVFPGAEVIETGNTETKETRK